MVAIDPEYCHQCGTELQTRTFDGRDRAWCPACERPLFRNAVPCVCTVVRDGDRVLFVQRAVEPVGRWEFPGGHPEYDEEPAVAAARELREEAGLSVPAEDLSLLTVQHSPYRDLHYNVIGYTVDETETTGDLDPGAEASTARFWAVEEVLGPPERGRDIDRDLLAAALDRE